jgi:hypothetical protein
VRLEKAVGHDLLFVLETLNFPQDLAKAAILSGSSYTEDGDQSVAARGLRRFKNLSSN